MRTPFFSSPSFAADFFSSTLLQECKIIETIIRLLLDI
ncbi:hypothetical protein MNBD_ALPHA11-195 [hydrothermal vent metagenome]|uniref:Uncharacterized protein n=1 Tax=hydrothermal vent metagenome TaxID=652676 RepID=A0A3B0UG38_9ZZZZ